MNKAKSVPHSRAHSPREKDDSILFDSLSLTPKPKQPQPLIAKYHGDPFAPCLNRKLEIGRSKRKVCSKSVVNSPRFEDDSSSLLNNYIKMEKIFDNIASSCSDKKINEVTEINIKSAFNAVDAYFFYDVPSVQCIFCPSSSAVCPHGSGLVGYCHFTRKIINLTKINEHVSYSKVYDTKIDSCVLLFPLFDSHHKIRAIIEIFRQKEFNYNDEKLAKYLQRKFHSYSKFIFDVHVNERLISEFTQVQRLDNYVQSTISRLATNFNCESAEIWELDPRCNRQLKDNQSVIYSKMLKYPKTEIMNQQSGIVGYAMKTFLMISIQSANTHSAYNAHSDGNDGDLSVLVVPFKDLRSSRVFGIVLRGKKFPDFFTETDEQLLTQLAPIIVSSLISSEIVEEKCKGIEESRKAQERLRSLISVAEVLSGQLKIDELIPTIMNRACQLVESDRCSLFIVNETQDKLVTFFHGGLDSSLEIPINSGIVGYTATTGQSLIIKDAYEDPRFNKQTDLETGYKTQSLLCVPIFDDKGNIKGVTEMINKQDGEFTDDDEKIIQVFNIFCGISIENARLYSASLDLSNQLRSVLEMSQSISQSGTIKKLLEEIMKNARKVIGAGRAMIYMANSNNKTEVFAIDEDIDTKTKKVEHIENTAKKQYIRKMMHIPVEATKIEVEKNNRIDIINRALHDCECRISNNPENNYNSMIVVPIIGADRTILGAFLMQSKTRGNEFTIEDQKMMESFAMFISISLERSQKKNGIALSQVEISIREIMSESDRLICVTPKNLQFNEEELKKVAMQNFSSQFIDYYKMIFWLFRNLEVKNELVYSYAYLLKESNLKSNILKNLDKAQFLVQFVDNGHLIENEILTKTEVILMLIAVLGQSSDIHDVPFNQNYDAFSCILNNESVDYEEMYHCIAIILILSQIKNGKLFNSTEKHNWETLMELLRSTTMKRTVEILDHAEHSEKVSYNWHQTQRIKFLCLIMTCINCSHLTRPFEIANNYLTELSNDFFKNGDVTHTIGMVFSTRQRKRENLMVEESRVGFVQNICILSFQKVGNIIPIFSFYLEQLKQNLSLWKNKSS
ncbi:3'5'-cyclic nucleotide phosphodiesterase family protein [Tritrichomonas foetus]|uniref:3'5'-cyclic nucleotide phosphodiesterase family protein n=1 Tax=Tritrichomonas foetus TaxID=1144522 RepID=A0A1J4JMX3_9EUKA|nr:3'5'-cyclic nucleotide phosphodiesterase family protein [Tritrichomonas foetus]|eukprot:OHT00042.1 3'5'-cyclic nucleotide phosphodiesterase family protein [Tritrichomonas foetus]